MLDYQNNQQLEWRLEFEYRAENHLLCTGIIPTDQFASMRQHPDFKMILQKIGEVKRIIQENKEFQFYIPKWREEINLIPTPNNTERLNQV